DEDLARWAERERLVLRLAEHGAERGAVAALDRDLDRRRAGGDDLAAELEEPVAAAPGGRGCCHRRAHECGEGDGENQTMLHLSGASTGAIELTNQTMRPTKQHAVASA